MIELDLETLDPVQVRVVDETSGLPTTAAPILAARPPWSVPIRLGDRSQLIRKVEI